MTTNYLLVELSAKMDHEERLQKSARVYEQLRHLPCKAQNGWRTIFNSWHSFFADSFMQQREVDAAVPLPIAKPITKSAAPEPLQLRPLCKNEEEWVKVFRMIQNRKLSVEQAAQLLIAMN